MNLDRDLRDALQPLAGDPVADAARVLRALPPLDGGPQSPRPRPGKPWPPTTWWLTTGGLLVGLLIGAFAGRWFGGSTPAPIQAPPQNSESGRPTTPPPPEPDPPKEEPKREIKPPLLPERPSGDPDYMVLMAFGEMTIDEPGEGVQKLEPMSYHVRAGTRYTTGEGQAGIYVLANDTRVRLDAATQARIGIDRCEFDRGRMYLCCNREPATMTIETPLATLQFDAGTDVILNGDAEGLNIVGMRGNVLIRTTKAETIRLGKSESVKLDARRGATPPERIEFLGNVTSWMTQMIILQQDPAELRSRVLSMVEAYEDGRQRAAAEIEIRRLGARCVPMLAYGAEKRLAEPDYVRGVATLVGELVDYDYAHYLFGLLTQGEADVREIIFAGIRRATGIAEGDAAFWRDADLPTREQAAQRWLSALKR